MQCWGPRSAWDASPTALDVASKLKATVPPEMDGSEFTV